MSKHSKSRPREIASLASSWQDLVILCRKCGGKLKGGFGDEGQDDLRRALRGVLRETGRRRAVRVIETGCLGVCPKGAVVAMRGAAPGRVLIVPKGQAAALVLETLGVSAAPRPSGEIA